MQHKVNTVTSLEFTGTLGTDCVLTISWLGRSRSICSRISIGNSVGLDNDGDMILEFVEVKCDGGQRTLTGAHRSDCQVLASASACERFLSIVGTNNTGRPSTWCKSPKSGCLAWCKEERLKSVPEHAVVPPGLEYLQSLVRLTRTKGPSVRYCRGPALFMGHESND